MIITSIIFLCIGLIILDVYRTSKVKSTFVFFIGCMVIVASWITLLVEYQTIKHTFYISEKPASNRIYEYEIQGNDTIPIDTIYTEGMSARTYYYK